MHIEPHDRTNVVDSLKGASTDWIKLEQQLNTIPLEIAMTFVGNDYNVGSVMRSAVAFGLRRFVRISDRRKWNRPTSMGTYHYIDSDWFSSVPEFLAANDSRLVLAETCDDAVDLCDYVWKPNSIIVMGSESHGLDFNDFANIDYDVVRIPMAGVVRSLNVSCAATTIMYEASIQLGKSY